MYDWHSAIVLGYTIILSHTLTRHTNAIYIGYGELKPNITILSFQTPILPNVRLFLIASLALVV